MKLKELYLSSFKHEKPKKTILLLIVVFILSCIYPSDMDGYYAVDRSKNVPMMVEYTEEYARFLPAIAQALVPIIMRDPAGLIQAINVGVFTTLSTQGLKFALDDVYVGNTRLGRRPRGSTSHHNMPSGHSSMALCSLVFLIRRYSFKWLWFLPLTFLTLYARFNYDSHTISAIVAGSILGIICALIFTSKKEQN